MESSLLALHRLSVTTNAVRFTDFQWVTFHLDAKSASRTLATGTAISRTTSPESRFYSGGSLKNVHDQGSSMSALPCIRYSSVGAATILRLRAWAGLVAVFPFHSCCTRRIEGQITYWGEPLISCHTKKASGLLPDGFRRSHGWGLDGRAFVLEAVLRLGADVSRSTARIF